MNDKPEPVLVFLDTETTSLRPDRRIWEVAGIMRQPGTGEESEFVYMITVGDLDLGNADKQSLEIGGFYKRHPQAAMGRPTGIGKTRLEVNVMAALEVGLRDAVIVGAVPNFDTEVIAARMRAHGLLPSWHYHLVDVETLAAGFLGIHPPWSFDQILAEFALAYDEADRHTALGDARMVRDLYDRVMGDPRRGKIAHSQEEAR